ADEAVAAFGDAAMTERLSKRVGVFRRTEALRATAKQAVDQNNASLAVSLLERANEIATPEQRAAVDEELRGALVTAGRGEDAILRELSRADMPKPERAARWTALARLRSERGDAAGATDALLQAATEEPSAARWAAVEASASTAGREHVRVEA